MYNEDTRPFCFASANRQSAIVVPSRRGNITAGYCLAYSIRTLYFRNMSPCVVCQRAHTTSSQRSLRVPQAIHSFISSATIPKTTHLSSPRSCNGIIIHGCQYSLPCLPPFRVLDCGDETHVSNPDCTHYPRLLTGVVCRRKTRASCTKFIERQVVRAWKRVTGATRKPQRTSVLMKDFVLVTSRRRSVMFR